jgi:hypothetical protein
MRVEYRSYSTGLNSVSAANDGSGEIPNQFGNLQCRINGTARNWLIS